MSYPGQRRKAKKAAVQLTSLLDLLFVMVFISLMQSKKIPEEIVEKTPEVPEQKVDPKPSPPIPLIKTKEIAKEKVTPKPKKKVEKPRIQSVKAVFSFYATMDNPSVPAGSFEMSGTFDEKTGKLSLGGTRWVERPKNFDMIPLEGTINAERTEFVGRVDFQGCQRFTLQKAGGKKGIAGEWAGSYVCQQGRTGLTLTISP